MKRFLICSLFAFCWLHAQDKKGGASYINTFGKGTAAVSRTVEDKFRDAINVRDYDAKCDDATIDTAAIQAAVNAAAAAGGGSVSVPPAKCLVAARISLPSNVSLIAAGPGATIKVADGAFNSGTNWVFPAADNAPTVISSGPGTTNVHVIGLTIDMNGANQTPTSNRNGSVYFYQVTKSSIEKCTFLYSLASTTDGTVIGSPVALLDQSDFNIVADNYIIGPGDVYTAGNFLAGGIFIQGVGNKIHHNDVIGTTDESYVANWYDAVPAFTTYGNIFEANTYQGVVAAGSLAAFHAESASGTKFIANKCIGPVARCLKASPEAATGDSMADVQFTDNSASGATNAGLSITGDTVNVHGVSRVSVTGGQYSGNAIGILLGYDVSEVRIDGVQINANTGPGIEVLSDDTYLPRAISILNNTITNNGSAAAASPGIIFWSTDAVTGTSFGPDVLIKGNIVTDFRSPKYQNYALRLLSSKGGFVPTLTRWRIGPNDFAGNLTAATTLVANNPILSDSVYLHNTGDPLDYVSKATVDWTETGDINSATDIYQNFHTSGFPNLYDFRIHVTGGLTSADARGFMRLHGNTTLIPDTAGALPACAGNEGTIRGVNNALTAVWGDTILGGGTKHVLAYCDGTNWLVAGGIPPNPAVSTSGGTEYTIPVFNGVYSIADSILTVAGSTVLVSAGDGGVNAAVYARNVATAGGLAVMNNTYYSAGWKRFAAGYPQMIGLDAAGGLTLNVAATGAKDSAITWNQIVIDPSGNVGIGTTGPRNGLEVSKLDSNYITSIRLGGQNQGTTGGGAGSEMSRNQLLFSAWRDVATDSTGAKIVAINYDRGGGLYDGQVTDLAFFSSNPSFASGDNTVERMRIKSSGNVGIGTAAPGAKLHVHPAANQNLYTRGPILNSSGIALQSLADDAATDKGIELYANSAPVVIGGTPIQFYVGNVEKARINTDGLLMANGQFISWKDSASTPITVAWLDGSNNFHVGVQAVPASAGDMFFYARGFDAFKLVKAPGGAFTLEPITDGYVDLGTSSKRFGPIRTTGLTVSSLSPSIATLDIESADEKSYAGIRGPTAGGGNYSIYLPPAGPGAANKILLTGAAPNYELTWSDPMGSNSVLTAACSAQLVLTTSYQDVAGATLALDRVGTWMVTGTFQAIRGVDDTGLMGRLDVDGSPVARAVRLAGTSTVYDQASLTQTWVVTIASQPKTIKLQAIKVGTGISTIEPTDTTLTALWVN